MFYLHQSNRTEFLLELLAKIMEALPLADPFAQEIVVVQSQGMARWLSLQLAARKKIAANISCPFPAALLWRLAVLHANCDNRLSPWDEEAFVWAILQELLRDSAHTDYPELVGVLCPEDRHLNAFSLARRLSALFDRYSIYRSDILAAWDRGEENDWPARLWRALVARHGAGHRAALFAALALGADKTLIDRAGLPERIAIFGVPTLPPLHLEIFARLGRFIDLHFFLLNPCQTYWQDLQSPERMALCGAETPETFDPVCDLHFETGNALLLGLGRLAGEFQQQLLKLDHVPAGELFDDPGDDSLLHAVQQDILWARHRPSQGPPFVFTKDSSIQIMVCHSPQREVEVLRDRLLDIFERHPDIEARDVLVMVPDISRYAPYVEALFSSRWQPAIPVTVADRAIAEKSLFFRSAIQLLRLLDSRMTMNEVFALLEAQPVRERFAIDIDDCAVIAGWVTQSGACWGLDQEQRQSMGLAGGESHTLMECIDRLFLGLFLQSDSWQMFDGLLPLPLDGMDQGKALAGFAAFVTSLRRFAYESRRPREMRQWVAWLKGLFATFLAETKTTSQDMILLHAQLKKLEDAATAGCGDSWLPFALVVKALEDDLALPARQGGFLAGGVTFCRMIPMRAIPFRVVCLLGMDDESFPRREHSLSIDRMAHAHRAGDRDRRDDDRCLFLETILSARDILYLSYAGRDAKNDSERPAAAMVDDLLDYLSESCDLPADEVRQQLVTRHPLQPFSNEYFDLRQSRLFSYDAMWEAVAQRVEDQEDSVHLVAGPDSGRIDFSPENKALAMDELVRFFSHPARFFLRKRLELDLSENQMQIQDRERFALDHLERYRLKSIFADLLGCGDMPVAGLAPAFASAGLVPVLPAGGAVFRRELDASTRFVRRLDAARGPLLDPLSGSLDLEGWTLAGSIASVSAMGQFFSRRVKYKELKMADYVSFWLGHLFFQAQTFWDAPHRETFFVSEDAILSLPPLATDEARRRLTVFIHLYAEGMTRPLPLFPLSSLVLARCLRKGEEKDQPGEAFNSAARSWAIDGFNDPAEKKKDRFLSACFDGPNPFRQEDPRAEEIMALARTVLEPFFFAPDDSCGVKR